MVLFAGDGGVGWISIVKGTHTKVARPDDVLESAWRVLERGVLADVKHEKKFLRRLQYLFLSDEFRPEFVLSPSRVGAFDVRVVCADGMRVARQELMHIAVVVRLADPRLYVRRPMRD